MDFYSMFKAGVNLGGWLSQFEDNNTNHYKTFITEEDIKIISDWGADHIRLPVDYSIIQENAPPYSEREECFYYIDRLLEWCKKQNLNVVLDLHRAAGQVYGDTINLNPLLSEDVNRTRFLNIWDSFSRRYKNVGDWLAFELLNEITDSTGYLWNLLYSEAVSVIRNVDKERIIVVGSDNSNSIFTLNELSILDDERIVYNFHYYDPLVFTHQKAHFSEDMRCYNKEIQYPGEIPELGDYLYKRPEFAEKLGRDVWAKNDKKLMEKYLEHASNFLKYTGKQLYCGEFGVIDTAPEQSAVRWAHDLIELLESYKIGRAYWSYKEMDFGLVDKKSTIKRAELLKQLF